MTITEIHNPIDREHFAWKVPVGVEGFDYEQGQETFSIRLVVPHSDPHRHEYPFDYMFPTVEEAVYALEDHDVEKEAAREGWVLIRVTAEIVPWS